MVLFVAGMGVAQSAAIALAIDCTCRYRGEDYQIGEQVCLKGPDGPSVATCGMTLNNTSWKFTKSPCPYALAPISPERLKELGLQPDTPVAQPSTESG